MKRKYLLLILAAIIGIIFLFVIFMSQDDSSNKIIETKDQEEYIESVEDKSINAIKPPVKTTTNSFVAEDAAIKKTIRGFYNAIVNQDCQTAIQLRLDYTISRCESIKDTSIKSLNIEQLDKTHAIAELSIQMKKKHRNKKINFNGFLRVEKNGANWKIMGRYQSKNKIDKLAYIDEYKMEFAPPESLEAADLAAPVEDIIESNQHIELVKKLKNRRSSAKNQKVVLIDISEQKLYLYDADNQLKQTYSISSALKGVGNQSGSDKTPLGLHKVSEKFGKNAKIGTIFKARANTGKIAEILTEPVKGKTDAVTTRILWLDGLEPGKNKGEGIDSHSRYIYIHGTPEEGLIGQPVSHGCIRMKNKDVITVFDELTVGSLVYIGQ